MKALILILSLIQLTINKVNACNGFQEKEIVEVVNAAKQLSAISGNDESFQQFKYLDTEIQKATNVKQAMAPINFNDSEHIDDEFSLGEVIVESNTKYGIETNKGSAYRIGRSCVLTAAHVLYPTERQEISPNNKGQFKGRIKFVTGQTHNQKEIKASVLFQMTKENVDYYTSEGEEDVEIDGKISKVKSKIRHFYGYSDPIILRLENFEGKESAREIRVISPKKLLDGKNQKTGRTITCMGSPAHMTEKNYGSCKGSNFKWKQENGRVFVASQNNGVASNLAFSPEMSGGPCYLPEDKNAIVGIAVNGYGSADGKIVMPNLEFENGDFSGGNARYIATLDRLDKRMKAELGKGLENINELCK